MCVCGRCVWVCVDCVLYFVYKYRYFLKLLCVYLTNASQNAHETNGRQYRTETIRIRTFPNPRTKTTQASINRHQIGRSMFNGAGAKLSHHSTTTMTTSAVHTYSVWGVFVPVTHTYYVSPFYTKKSELFPSKSIEWEWKRGFLEMVHILGWIPSARAANWALPHAIFDGMLLWKSLHIERFRVAKVWKCTALKHREIYR